MNGQKSSAAFDCAFVAFGFKLRDTHADEGSNDSTYGSADTEASERSHNGTSCDKWADTGDGERADSGEQAEGGRR